MESLTENQRVRFVKKSRCGSFNKGTEGIVRTILAPGKLYLIEIVDEPLLVWATSDDLIPWNQLSLF